MANLLFEDRINEILDTLRLENDLENTKITFCTFDEHHFDKHQTTDIDDIESVSYTHLTLPTKA